jgi:hypothetical protein
MITNAFHHPLNRNTSTLPKEIGTSRTKQKQTANKQVNIPQSRVPPIGPYWLSVHISSGTIIIRPAYFEMFTVSIRSNLMMIRGRPRLNQKTSCTAPGRANATSLPLPGPHSCSTSSWAWGWCRRQQPTALEPDLHRYRHQRHRSRHGDQDGPQASQRRGSPAPGGGAASPGAYRAIVERY